jgi:PAS domain S-box-containing protein
MSNQIDSSADSNKPAAYRYDDILPAESAMLEELLKATEIQQLFESYYNLITIPVAIIDLNANVLLSSRWQRICTQFHRVNPMTCSRCIECDTQLATHLQDGKTYTIYPCKNGLTDCASPIIIEGKYIANLFIGQFLTEAPDESRFRMQAEEFGFDAVDYLAALHEVPIVDAEKIPVILDMLVRMTRVITNLGIERKHAVDNQARQSIILNTIPQSVFWKNRDGIYLGCNAHFAKAVGLACPDDIVGKTDFDLPWPREEAEAYRADDRVVISANCPRLHIIEPLQQADGSRLVIDTSKVPLVDASTTPYGVLGVYEDITERKRSEEAQELNSRRTRVMLQLNQMTDATIQEITNYALEEAVSLTQSKIGYLAFLNDDESILTMHSWSKSAMAVCAIDQKPIEYPVVTTGLWGEAVRQRQPVITNDYAAANPLKKGYPQGHVTVTRHMNIPVFFGSRIVLVAGVGNKTVDYDFEDVQQLTLLMEGMWHLLERKKTKESLQNSERRYRQLFDACPDGIVFIGTDGCIKQANIAQARMYRYDSPDDMNGVHATLCVAPSSRDYSAQIMRRRLSGEEIPPIEYDLVRKDGTIFFGEISAAILRNADGTVSGYICVTHDMTERKQAEDEKMHLESQLHQAQKMESIGSLAGGVAHDFNNKLSVIIGCCYMASTESDPARLQHFIEEIQKAAEQSAALTRQLLAFARKQTIAPQVLNLNETVTGMFKMLVRLIGENIPLTWQPANDLWLIKFDPSQIDQILANLCINARDSITDGGKIVIETENCTIDEYYSCQHPESIPGEYVKLIVSDNGCGMDRETQARIFEPFFTTKEAGKGTGLGLATVFGIVKQNNGFINVYSEVGLGTTFTLYLPRYVGMDAQVSRENLAQSAPSGFETILVVEDELAILDIVSTILTKQGYNVLQANTPAEAIRQANEYAGTINLLLTDVIMPGMNGKELAHNLQTLHPQLKCIFMSGYTSDAIAQHGVLDESICFIQKPLSLPDLAKKVREVLDDKNRSE